MRYAPRALLAGGLGFAVSALVACGGGAGLLSANQANSLSGQLDTVASAVGAGQCVPAANAAKAFNTAVANLNGSTVNTTLQQNLSQGAQTVAELAAKDCTTTTSTTTTTTTTSSSTTSTTPTTTTQATTATAPTTTTSTTPPATTPTGSGTTSTGGSGGAGIGGGTGTSGAGGAGNGNGNGGNGQ
jgi:hypothetical protein